MSYIALYRKYRPIFFKDVVGQKIIIQTLKNAIKYEKIHHCYLFNGNKGTGKTTIAKIFAKAINCLQNNKEDCCGKCEACLFTDQQNSDIIEIDGASYNGIEEIRVLKNKINYKSNFLKYKVYIIDEIHVLTTNAFNALLKILEEPPKNIIFIFATTEINKIPETIISRTQNFNFNNIQDKYIIEKLKTICEIEKIKIDDEVLNKIAFYSKGSLRDALNLLDQIYSYQNETITMKDLQEIKGLVPSTILKKLIKHIFVNDFKSAIMIIKQIQHEGKNILLFIEELIIMLKNILLEEIFENKKSEITKFSFIKANKILKNLLNYQSNLKDNDNKEILLELIFIQILSDDNHNNSIKKENLFNNNSNDFTISKTSDLETITASSTPIKNLNIQKMSHYQENNSSNYIKDTRKKKIFDILFNNNDIKKQKLLKAWHRLKNYQNENLKKAADYLFHGQLIAISKQDEMLLVYKDNNILQKIIQKEIKQQILSIFNIKKTFIKDYFAISQKDWQLFEPSYLENFQNEKNISKYRKSSLSETSLNKNILKDQNEKLENKINHIKENKLHNQNKTILLVEELFANTKIKIK